MAALNGTSTRLTEMDKDPNMESTDPETEYKGGNAEEGVPVEEDKDVDALDSKTEDSAAMLRKDDADAIDKSNIVSGSRSNKPAKGQMREPGDQEGLPKE